MTCFEKFIILEIFINHVIIIKDGDSTIKGYLPKKSIPKEIIENLKIGKVVTVRFLENPDTEFKYPIFTQREVFFVDREYELTVIREDDYKIFLEYNGFDYFVNKVIWERGPAYKSHIVGSKINCRVYKINEDYPFFTREKVDNPYFTESVSLIFNDKKLKEKFSLFVDSQDDEINVQMFEDYKSGNANWLFSYISLFEKDIHDSLERYDYKNAKENIKSLVYIDRWIMKSGFLLTQDDAHREKTKRKLENSFKRWDNIIESIDILSDSDKIHKIILKLLEMLRDFPNIEINEIGLNLSTISFILKHQNLEFSYISEIEEITSLLTENNLLFLHENDFFEFRIRLTERRKQIRRIIFETKNNLHYEDIINNKYFSHFLFLKEFEAKSCFFYGDEPQSALESFSIKFYKSLTISSKHDRLKTVENILSSIESLKFSANVFNNSENRIIWSHNKNILLGRIYEYVSTNIEDRTEKIDKLNMAYNHYKRGKFNRTAVIIYYIKFYEFLNILETNNELTILAKIKEINKRLARYKNTPTTNTIIKSFCLFYNILNMLGDNSLQNLNYLLDQTSIINQSDIFEIDKISRIVLANNIISPLVKHDYYFLNILREYLLDGSFSLPLPYVHSRDELEIDSNHEIFLEEQSSIEFKGSYSFDIYKYVAENDFFQSDRVIDSFMKTVVGMLNKDGGKIYIGILELDRIKPSVVEVLKSKLNCFKQLNRLIIGVEPEIDMLGWDVDAHIRHIMNKLRKRINDDIGLYVDITPDKLNEKNIYIVNIARYPHPEGVCLDQQYYYVRESNETIKKSPQEFIKYRLNLGIR